MFGTPFPSPEGGSSLARHRSGSEDGIALLRHDARSHPTNHTRKQTKVEVAGHLIKSTLIHEVRLGKEVRRVF